MTKSHSKDLIDTFDQNPCQERRQGFISDGASLMEGSGVRASRVGSGSVEEYYSAEGHYSGAMLSARALEETGMVEGRDREAWSRLASRSHKHQQNANRIYPGALNLEILAHAESSCAFRISIYKHKYCSPGTNGGKRYCFT